MPYTPKTAEEPMYVATRFYLWCRYVGADPKAFSIGRWIN